MYLRQLRKMVGRGMSHISHQDQHMPRITRDEADVQSEETPKAQFHDKITKKRLKSRYTKEYFCKQFKQRHSTSRQESICPHGPCDREPPSPDERSPFPPTRTIAMGARQWRRYNEKDKQSCSG